MSTTTNRIKVTVCAVRCKGVNGYPLPCYYLGSKITNGYPWKHGRNVPAGALHSRARRGVMQMKLTEEEQANHARDARQPRWESL